MSNTTAIKANEKAQAAATYAAEVAKEAADEVDAAHRAYDMARLLAADANAAEHMAKTYVHKMTNAACDAAEVAETMKTAAESTSALINCRN